MAGETYKILDLDIDYSKLITTTTQSKKVLADMKAELNELKKAGKEGTDEFTKLDAEFKAQQNVVRVNTKLIADYVQAGEGQNLTIEQMRKLLSAVSVQWSQLTEEEQNNTEEGKALTATKTKLTEELKRLEAATGDNRRNVGNYTQSIIDATNSTGIFGGQLGGLIDKLVQLKTTFETVKAAIIAQAAATEANTAATVAETTATTTNTAIVEANTVATTENTVSNEVNTAVGEANVAATEANTAATASNTTATVASTTATTGLAGSMRILKIALASTGIGILIIALGFLITYLSKFDPIIDKIEQVFSGFGAAINVVTKNVVSFFQNITSVGDFLTKTAKLLANPIQGFKDLGKSMSEAAVAAAALTKAQQDLEDAQKIQEVSTAKAKQKIDELIVQSKNRSLTEKERQDLLKEAASLDKEDFDRRNSLAQQDLENNERGIKIKAQLNAQEISNLKAKGVEYAIELLNQGKITNEDVEAYKKAQLAKIAILDESTTRQEKIQNQSDALAEKAEAKRQADAKAAEEAQKKKEEARKKAQDSTLKAMQEELELMDAISGKGIKSENQLVEAYTARRAIIEKEHEFGRSSETKYQTDLANLDTDFITASAARLKSLADLRIKDAEEELALLKLTHETKIKDGKLLTDQLIQQELERLSLVKDAAEEIERQRFQAGEITAKEFRAFQLQADKEFLDAQQALYDEKAQQVRDAKAIDMANDLELMKLQGASEYDLQREQLQRQYDAEIAQANKVAADTQKIKQKYAEANKKIDKAEKDNQLKLTADVLGNIAELLGKNTAAGKAAAIAQAGINTYLGVSQILAAPPSGPEPANTIIKGVAIAATIATGIANVAKIAAIKAERGGKFGSVGGNLHTQGGTKYYGDDGNVIEMERDENFYVLNRGASRAINSLSSLNEYYGGVGFSNPSRRSFYADGGMVSRSLEVPDISPQIASAVAEAISGLKIYTDVKDVIRETGNHVQLVDGANI